MTLLMAGLGYFALRTSQTTLEDAIGKNSADLAEQILDKISRNIHTRVEEMQAFTTCELAQQYLPLSNAQFENMSDPNGYIAQIDRDWVNGAELPIISEITHNELAIELRSRQKFYQNKYGYPLVGEIFVTNRYGANVSQTGRTTDYYQADEDWWQIAKRYGLSLSDIKYDESSGIFSTEIAIRIDDANGNFIGVIKAAPNIKETVNIINEAKLAAEYKTTQLHLINKNSKIIYSTKGYGFFEDVNNQIIPICAGLDQPRHKCYLVGEKVDGKGILFAHAHSHGYKDFKGLGWTLVTETDTAEIFAPIVDLRNTMLLAGVVIMGLALLASSITYRSIVVPIAELQKATIQIASGNLDTNLTKSGFGEIGQLANSFQRMAQRLKKTIEDLSDEVDGRKNTEAKLRQNEQFLGNIFDSIQDGIGIMDKDLNIIKTNPWLEETHRDSMPLIGKKCFKAYHNRDSACPDCPCVKTLNTGKPQTMIIPNPCKGIKAGWIELSAFPLKDQNGNITGAIEYIKDVTERNRIENALRESEVRLKTIFDNIQTGIFIIDPDTHKIVYANPIAAHLTNASQEQLVGSICHKYVCPAEKGRCPVTDLGQEVDNAERILLTVKGEKRAIIKTVVTITLDGRKHLLESFVDVTEHKKAELALEKLNKDLEAAVQELSRSNIQLQDFVHIAAHDLKTPVRGIGTLADWIISDYGKRFDDQGRNQLNLLKARVLRIDKLINGMLQFSKLVINKEKKRQVDLNMMVSEIIYGMSPSDKIEIAVDSLPDITCEYEHLELVFHNLLTNAITFMDKPKGLIKVGCVEQGDFWKFYVRDNGPGIDQKYFDKIFKIFQTLTSKDEPETTGIGLAVVKKIIELYGGKIWVESQPGSGSTFFFTFHRHIEEPVYAKTKANTAC